MTKQRLVKTVLTRRSITVKVGITICSICGETYILKIIEYGLEELGQHDTTNIRFKPKKFKETTRASRTKIYTSNNLISVYTSI